MTVRHDPCALWTGGSPPAPARLLDLPRPADTLVFFRADDVAAPDPGLAATLDLFAAHGAPLDMAVVPAWLTFARAKGLLEAVAANPKARFHQHGWRHANHQREGRKAEFGGDREEAALRHDMARGRDKLDALLGERLDPVFTPPWNRMGEAAVAAARDLGFGAVSTWLGPKPLAPKALPDLAVNADLHTRKEATAEAAWEALGRELAQGLAFGRLGVMLHHQRQNAAGLAWLDALLKALAAAPGLRLVNMRELPRVAVSVS